MRSALKNGAEISAPYLSEREGGRSDMKKLNRSIKSDLVLLSVLLLVGLSLLLVTLVFRKEGTLISIEEGGSFVMELGLYENGEYSLADGKNILVIENGEAYMKHADCPDHRCVKMGRVKYRGQRIICLPNEVTVAVGGGGGVDIVS